jgi:hypothetical protein
MVVAKRVVLVMIGADVMIVMMIVIMIVII